MTKLAQEGQGNLYFAESAQELPGIFDAEIGDALKPVASKSLVGMWMEGMQVCSAPGKNNTMQGRMLVEAHSLFQWDLLEKFLTHEVISDKWERAIHFLEP